MPQFMLDTNVCVYVIKNHPEKLRERYNRFAEQIAISTVTLAELCYGAEKSRRRAENLKDIEAFASNLDILSFSPSAAAHYGQLRAELVRRGRTIGPNDLLIAAHARAEGLVVVTNNAREFRRVPGLRVENWV